MNKILIILSFLIVGIVLVTNEPPTYSREKYKENEKEKPNEVIYDISAVQKSINSDIHKFKNNQKKLEKAVILLSRENRYLKNEIKKDTVITKTIEKDSTIVIEKKGFFKRIAEKLKH
jgi:hypothetical protein